MVLRISVNDNLVAKGKACVDMALIVKHARNWGGLAILDCCLTKDCGEINFEVGVASSVHKHGSPLRVHEEVS